MKKKLFFFAAMAAAVWFTGCNKEEDEPSPEDYFQVHFDANGATEGTLPEDMTMIAGKTYKIPIRPEWVCSGLAHKNSDGSFEKLSCKKLENQYYEFKYQPKNYAIKQDTLYLVWEYRNITITYHANGATGEEPPPITIDVPKSNGRYTMYSLSDTIILANGDNLSYQDGYYFAGWNTKADGTGTFLPKGFKYVSPSSVDLYADFETLNDHEYVDLGLPSGTLWAKTNVGTTCEAKEGALFAFGETSPKTEYTYENWTLRVDDFNFVLTTDTYQNASIINDKRIEKNNIQNKRSYTLMYMEDAASVNWGKLWRIPTTDEWKELFDNCTVEEYRYDLIEEGKTLYSKKLTSKINGNYIILPAFGAFSASNNYIYTGVTKLENKGYFTKMSIWYDKSQNYNTCSRFIWTANGNENEYDYWDGVAVRPVTKLK